MDRSSILALSLLFSFPAACSLVVSPGEVRNPNLDTGSGGSGGAGGAGEGGSGGAGEGGSGGGMVSNDPASRLTRYLTGTFDSEAQSITNPQYFAIQLKACRIALPELGERVLYIEQAQLQQPQNPYRQRLYVVEPGADPETQARSRVFELLDPAVAVGLCDDPASSTLTAANAEEKAGCAVELTWMEDHFVGGTQGNGCPSTLNGASYATSEVTAYEDRLETWDRGYDANDQQVWGAVAGPYIFDRKTAIPTE